MYMVHAECAIVNMHAVRNILICCIIGQYIGVCTAYAMQLMVVHAVRAM
jgi:hypothetical protein